MSDGTPDLFPELPKPPPVPVLPLSERIDRALQGSIDNCARCKTCEHQVDAVLVLFAEVLAPKSEESARLRAEITELRRTIRAINDAKTEDPDGPVLTRRIGVTGRSGGPLTISGEAVAALADAGVVPVRQCDLAAVLAEGVVPEDSRTRLEQAAAWQGEAGPVPLRDDLVTVSRDDLRAALSAHLEGRAYSVGAVAAAGRLAQAAGLTS